MKTYKVSIIETLEKTVNIEALNKIEALCKAKQTYKNEDIILDGSDCVDTDFEVLEEVEQEIYINKNTYGIVENTYSLDDFAKLMREFKDKPDVIYFLADKLMLGAVK